MSVSGQTSARQSAATAWAAYFFALIWVFASAPATAVSVSGLYTVEVPVAGSDPEQLAEGYAAGLSRVLVRVSGSRDVLSLAGVDAILADAESLLLSYQVLRGADGNSRLSMAFGAVGVNRALASIEAPVWGANRPLTLAWVAVEDRGTRTLITQFGEGGSPSTVSEVWSSAFHRAARERGLPIVLPPASVQGDRQLLSEIWGQFIDSVRSASSAMDHDVLALVRVNQSGGQWRAGWVFDGVQLTDSEESVSANTPEALAEAVVNRWAELYAGRYAVAAGDIGELPQVDIVLKGVTTLADYGKASQALESFTPVVSVGASRVKGSQLTLRVAFSGELDQLKQYIALDPRFVAIEGAAVSTVRSDLARETPAQPEPEPQSPPPSGPPADPGLTDDGSPEAVDGKGPADQAMFSYQPAPVDEQEAEQAFESLYQVLYYRWQPAPVISNGGGK